MANYDIRIDLLKLAGASIQTLKGKTTTKKCIIIPVENAPGFYLGAKGCYLDLSAFEMQNPQFKDTHCVKVSLSKDQREKLSEDERRALTPIIGGLHPFGGSSQQATLAQAAPAPGELATAVDPDNDLPF